MGQKNFGSKKFWVKKILVQIFFRDTKKLGQKKVWVKNFLGQKNFGSKKFWVKKYFGSKNFERKKFWSKRFGSEIFLSKKYQVGLTQGRGYVLDRC